MEELRQKLERLKVVPVITIKDASNADRLAEVLVENGLPCAEITFRTEQAAMAMRNMRNSCPDILIGAGTVLNQNQVDQAIAAGADFLVSPGLNPSIVKYCQERSIPIIPGVNNPSLVEQAMDLGLKTLKFFPAEASGGTAMLKALTAVYPVNFMPTGGISLKNIDEYLSISSVVACGGTWIVPTKLIDEGQWDALGQLVKEVTNSVT